MSKMAQVIILILFLLLGGSVFMVLQTLNQKQVLEKSDADLKIQMDKSQEREKNLIKEKKNLEDQLQKAQEAKTGLEKETGDLREELTGLKTKVGEITTERDDWKSRVDAIKHERDELMAKLTSREKESEVASSSPTSATPTVVEIAPPTKSDETAAKTVPSGADQDRYWADVLKERADLSLQLEKYKVELDSKVLEIEELKKQNTDLNTQLSQLKDTREDVERKIQYGAQLADNLSMELARIRNDRKFYSDKVDRLQKENEGLRTEIKNLNNTKIALEKSISRITEDKHLVEKKLMETEGLIQGRIDEIWQIKESLDESFKQSRAQTADSKEVELPPIIVTAPNPAVSANAQEGIGFNGKIVSINEHSNFVIVDLGENSGIQMGEMLNVYRGAQNIAKLEVIQVRKDISAADIKQKTGSLQVGDTVK